MPFTSTAGNVGCFFWSHDIGGHMGGRNEESYVRWCQFGALSAALRSHSTRDATMDRRPWKYPKWAEDSMRKSFHLRCELFPYIYSSAAQSCRESVPLTRPMYIDYPDEEEAYHNPQEFMLGDHLLVAPITSPGEGPQRRARQVVWFPPGDDWYDFFTGKCYVGGTEQLVSADIDTFPLYVRGGTPIPTQAYTPRMAGAAPASIIVRYYPDKDGLKRATTLYEDDGISPAYRNGQFATTRITCQRNGEDYSIEIERPQGTHAGQPNVRKYFWSLRNVEVPGRVKLKLPDQLAPITGEGEAGFFDKIESPQGFPARATRYLYLPKSLVNADERLSWKMVQTDESNDERHIIAKWDTPLATKLAVPKFPTQSRPSSFKFKPSLEVQGPRADQLKMTEPMSWLERAYDAARDATAAASSCERDYSPAGAIDGVADGYPHGKHYEWASNHEKAGATLKLQWDEPQRIDAILLYDRPNLNDQVTAAVVTFDDGSNFNVGTLPNDGKEPTEVRFEPRTVRLLELKITGVSDTTQNAGLAEIAVFRAP